MGSGKEEAFHSVRSCETNEVDRIFSNANQRGQDGRFEFGAVPVPFFNVHQLRGVGKRMSKNNAQS